MTTVKKTIQVNRNLSQVWETVLNVERYAQWRSDLSKTVKVNEKQFIEYSKEGIATVFTITAEETYKRWEFAIENENITGHWIGIFTDKGTTSKIECIEHVTAKKQRMKPFIKGYLKKQQAQFAADLKKFLEQ